VELSALERAPFSLQQALALEHDELPREAVLCGKLIAACWLVTGQVVYLRDDPVGFGGLVLPLAHGHGFVQAMIFAQLCAILTVLCSRFFRTGCALLAGCIAVMAVLDQALFSNNRACSAALLTMLALGGGGRGALLARVQLSVVYGCAALDKLLAADWRSGVFLRTFSAQLCRTGELWSPSWSSGAPLPLTCTLADLLARHGWLASACSGLVIATELALALGYLRAAGFTAPLAVAFHALLFVATGSTFGMFFYAGAAGALLVVDLARMPAPFDRAWPWFTAAGVLAGPWVRPWFALVLAAAVAVSAPRVKVRALDVHAVERKRRPRG
jgi:hypothetical protein